MRPVPIPEEHDLLAHRIVGNAAPDSRQGPVVESSRHVEPSQPHVFPLIASLGVHGADEYCQSSCSSYTIAIACNGPGPWWRRVSIACRRTPTCLLARFLRSAIAPRFA